MSTLTRLTPLAVLLIVVVALVAPDPGPTAGAGKLSLWRLKTYIPPADKILDANAQECAKKAGMELAIQTYTFDDMWTKYTAAIESKTLPDIAELDAVGPARLANLGRLSDMSDVVGGVTKELGPILANAEGAVKFGGKYYAVPHYGIPLVLFYRKDILEKIGAEPPDTWEAIQQISQKVKQAGIHDFPNGFPWNRTGDGYDPAMSLLWSYGAAWVDKSGKFTGIPKGPAVQALKVVTSAYLVDKTAAFDYLSWSGSTNNESFMAGKITFTPNGPSILFQEESNKHPLQKDTAIKLMPKGPAGRNLALTFVMNWGVPVDGKQQKEAKAVVGCIMSRTQWMKYMTGSFQQAVPLFARPLDDPYWNTPNGKTIVETVKLGHPVGWPGPTTPAAAEVVSSNVLTDMITQVIVDKVTPEAAVDEANKRIKEIYDRLPVK
ncbi:MAG TPA: extracellular solute-binding protein [Methylomirabilota bacterium]|nr:extracellular solute-binding protein [Methylomirabilota bacterium]